MVEGCLIRELPDGGKEFVLDEPSLSFIRIDERSTLQFGRTEVTIGGPFAVEIAGTVHHLDSRRSNELGPLVALYPGTARWLWATPAGELMLRFQTGSTLTVAPDRTGRSWLVGGVDRPPEAD
ncbi:MAG: DUF6188 family protein [Acidimicrobiales bacterium]